MKYFYSKKNKGYVALITLLILAFVSLVLATTFTEISIGEGKSSRSQSLGEDSLGLVESCVHEAMRQVARDTSYYGVDLPITLPDGTCLATITSPEEYGHGIPDERWYMDVRSTTLNLSARRIQVIFMRGPQIEVLLWVE